MIADRFAHIEDALDYLIRLEEANAADLALVKKTMRVTEVFTVSELAIRYRFSASSASRCPWKLPNFGKPDLGESPKRWHRGTVDAWYARSEDERRREWELMSPEQRRKALGVAA